MVGCYVRNRIAKEFDTMNQKGQSETDDLSDYDIYGKTPPRTKILRKSKAKKDRYSNSTMSQKKIQTKLPLPRRNTISSMFDEFVNDVENLESYEGTKKSKRQIKLLRGAERDLKLDIGSAQVATYENVNGNDEDDIYPKTPGYQIKCSKPFMSLMCRTITSNKAIDNNEKCDPFICDSEKNFEKDNESLNEGSDSKLEFYQALKALIHMGSGEKYPERNTRRLMSKEEVSWQNEVKDVIWLELQAYHAERSPMEQDCYLCTERENVEPILNDIKNYRFRRVSRRYSTQNSDSGVEDDCPGCLSIHCISCLEAQNDALRDIEKLLSRLEEVENLFPSSKAFAELYPLYSSPEIVGRVKAMCLWYNMTKHQRLKFSILKKLFRTLEIRQGDLMGPGDDSSTGSPSDSNNSTGSSTSDFFSLSNIDLYDIEPIANFLVQKGDTKGSPYRKYIENVLKTRGVKKSFMFLKRMHTGLLQKTKLTLTHWNDEEISQKIIFNTEDEELQRFGVWSPEAKSMGLPSYRTLFLFLALIPLEVVHAYLIMRIEQKPEKPSPLSVKQLMRELREGLQLTLHERQLACNYIECAISGMGVCVEYLWEKISDLDKCLIDIFKDYLEYLEQWILISKCSFQKNFVEEEYQFCSEVCEDIGQCKVLMDEKFLKIFSLKLTQIGNILLQTIDNILKDITTSEQGGIKQKLFSICRELQNLFNGQREMTLKILAFGKTCFKNMKVKHECYTLLKESIMGFKDIIPCAIGKVEGLFERINTVTLDDADKNTLNSRIREILIQCYRLGFDHHVKPRCKPFEIVENYDNGFRVNTTVTEILMTLFQAFYKEMADMTPAEFRGNHVSSMIEFANLWMKFARERCERGRGMRPRWAYQGMDFLLTICEPKNTQHLSNEIFEKLKKEMDLCISHVIGTSAPTTPESGVYSLSPRSSLEQIRSRSRGSSPCTRPSYKSQRSGVARKLSSEQSSPGADVYDNGSSRNRSRCTDKQGTPTIKLKTPDKSHSERYEEAALALDIEIDTRLKGQKLIGKVLQEKASNKNTLCRRVVTFSWQRGIKIGQGRFGKVYTAVNNTTGDMMAVKEIALQHNNNTTVKSVAEEIKILEGITHDNLVRYYGVEIHKDEMLIFMEYCSEGTLENLVAASEGLSELLVRRYTYQLVSGVLCLHEHNIVHRDIKTANIFLTNGGNCLKIGDFGCAVKIKSNVTMPGELRGFVGTQAYMAPEVFTRNMTEGHGRAADIWSVGCVVVEMASGKRPWSEYDSNFQIMFKVGMGQSPDPPDDMIDEGLDFLDMCFKHNPKERATARELLEQCFVKIGEEPFHCN